MTKSYTFIFGTLSILGAQPSVALADDIVMMETMAVTAPRLQQSALLDAMTLREINEETIAQKQPRTMPEALSLLPGVMVQKTANGQGSPFIRGFTGYRTLTLIDGVRYNNSVYRDGPSEYFSLINVGSLENIELLSGPASSLYGSDAIGGTLNLQTRQSKFQTKTEAALFTLGAQNFRYATAEHSFVSRTELDVGVGGKWGVLTSFSRKNYGDIDAADLGQLDKTGYDEDAFDMRFDLALNEHWNFTAEHQNLKQDDVWRTHSTIYSKSFAGTEVGSDLQRLKDQERQLNYLKFSGDDFDGFVKQVTLTLSHQQWQEQGDRIKSNGKRIDEYFDSNMYGIDLQLDSTMKNIALTYGFDFYLDKVDSGRVDFKADGSVDKVRIQGPIGDDAEFGVFGSYIQARFNLTDRLAMSMGSRYSYVYADIGRYEDPVTNAAASYDADWDKLSSSVRLAYDISQTTTVWGGVSQSFRAPNIADLTRYGKSRSTETEVAATGLSAEKFLTYETGFKFRQSALAFNGTYFYTDIEDFITSTPTGNIVDGLIEVSKQNSAEGYVQGIELELQYHGHKNWHSYADVTWLEGRLTRQSALDDYQMITEPFTRIMPLTSHFGIKWTSDNQNQWLGVDITLAAKADKLSAGDESDTQRIPPGGTPSYQLLNLYSGWRLDPNMQVTVQLNNVFDEAYRNHGSGSNEPGRNLILAVTAGF